MRKLFKYRPLSEFLFKEPEERINHYPIEALTGIYFGANTPETAKERIYQLISKKGDHVGFYDCVLSGNSHLEFKEWEYFEECVGSYYISKTLLTQEIRPQTILKIGKHVQ